MTPSQGPSLNVVTHTHGDLTARPGQFLLTIPSDSDPSLPQVAWPFEIKNGFVRTVVFSEARHLPDLEESSTWRGPYGAAFSLPSQPRRALILAGDPFATALLYPVICELIGRQAEVALACTPEPWIERYLPEEVEIRVSERVLDDAADLLAWTDLLYACGDAPWLDAVLDSARAARLKLERGWGQLLYYDVPMPCGVGVCGLCAYKTRGGVTFNCVDGPVIDLVDWLKEE